jgi:hypothetical protein
MPRAAGGVIGSNQRALEAAWKGEMQHALKATCQTPHILQLFWHVVVKPNWNPAVNCVGGAQEYLVNMASNLTIAQRPEPNFGVLPKQGKDFPFNLPVLQELQKEAQEDAIEKITPDELLREGVVIDANGGIKCDICDVPLAAEELKQHLHLHYSKGGGQKHQKIRKMARDFRKQLQDEGWQLTQIRNTSV